MVFSSFIQNKCKPSSNICKTFFDDDDDDDDDDNDDDELFLWYV